MGLAYLITYIQLILYGFFHVGKYIIIPWGSYGCHGSIPAHPIGPTVGIGRFSEREDLGTTQTLADASCRAAENIATVELPVQEAIPRGDGGDVFRGGGVVDG